MAARKAYRMRKMVRRATQNTLTPAGKWMSRFSEIERSFDGLKKELAGYERYLAIAESSGRSRGWISKTAWVSARIAPVLIGADRAISVDKVLGAPAGEQGRTAAGEGGRFLGGSMGAYAGGAVATGAVVFLAGSPPGWVVIGVGILGGGAGGYFGGEAGESVGKQMYDIVEEPFQRASVGFAPGGWQ